MSTCESAARFRREPERLPAMRIDGTRLGELRRVASTASALPGNSPRLVGGSTAGPPAAAAPLSFRLSRRPAAQIDYYHRGGSRTMLCFVLYCLAKRGEGNLRRAPTCRSPKWCGAAEGKGEAGLAVPEHALMVSDHHGGGGNRMPALRQAQVPHAARTFPFGRDACVPASRSAGSST